VTDPAVLRLALRITDKDGTRGLSALPASSPGRCRTTRTPAGRTGGPMGALPYQPRDGLSVGPGAESTLPVPSHICGSERAFFPQPCPGGPGPGFGRKSAAGKDAPEPIRRLT
jgi:hypothetical protein